MIHPSIVVFLIHALLVLGLSYSMQWSHMMRNLYMTDERLLSPLPYNATYNNTAEKIVKWCEAYRTLYRMVDTARQQHSEITACLGILASVAGCVVANSFLLPTMSWFIAAIISLAIAAVAYFIGGALVIDRRNLSMENLERDYKTFKAEETCAKILQDANIDPKRFSPFDYYVVTQRAEYLETAAPAYVFAARFGNMLGFVCYFFCLVVLPALLN